jgi:hypothetical protein
MAIYRGVGGAGEANDDATLNAVTEKAQDAATSASEAATSATSAASSATTATTKASEASTSASNAASSASAAASSATAAATSATSSATSATTATTKASEAATSATNAATSATSASNSATTATTQASAASTSASNAATSATAAQTAQTAAETALDAFDDRYIGSKTSAPTVDNDGNALTDGALYFNTTTNLMNVYDLATTAWLEIPNMNITGLNDTTITSVTDNEVLAYDSTSSKWINQTAAEAGLATATQGSKADSALQNLVEDTTPQLGGTLDANGQKIDMGTNDITDTKVGNWNTAYGWGDHSTQGYATETYATGEALALAIALG